MFESSLISLDQKKQRGKRWLSFPLAVGLHLVVLVSLGFAQYWNVDRIPEPDTIGPVIVELAPPPMARGERDGRTIEKHVATVKPAVPSTPVQPPTVPDQPVPGPTTPEPAPPVTPTTSGTNEDGPAKGDPNGVEHGDPNGVIDGKGPIGSTTHGMDTSADMPLTVGGAVTRPVIVERVEPQYTETARRVRLEGTVIVQAVIDEQGRVTDVKVLKNLPMGLDQAAVDAVSRWRFQPATLHGRPVKVYYSLTVVFRVQ
jgi:TonB family protein